ncbi:hypothetical protein D9M68_922400 [compost metagenome]
MGIGDALFYCRFIGQGYICFGHQGPVFGLSQVQFCLGNDLFIDQDLNTFYFYLCHTGVGHSAFISRIGFGTLDLQLAIIDLKQ